jgi:fucose permease
VARARQARIIYGSAFVYGGAFVQGLLAVSFPASAAVLRSRGLSDAQYGSLFAPQLTLAAAGALGAGTILDHLGARRALALGFLLMALSQVGLLAAGAGSPAPVYCSAVLGTACLGIGAGIAAGPLNAYPQVLFPGRSESAVLALHTVAGTGLAVVPVLAGIAFVLGRWALLPLVLLAGCLVVVGSVLRSELPSPEPHGDAANGRLPLRSPGLWLFIVIAFAYGLTESVYGYWTVVFLTEERALGAASAGAALTSFWSFLSIGRAAAAALVLHLAAEAVLPAAAVFMAIGALLVPAVATGQGAATLLAVGGLGCSAVLPLALALAGRRFPAHRTRATATVYAALCSGLAGGSFATGLLRSLVPLATVYRLAAGPALLAACLAVVALRRRG